MAKILYLSCHSCLEFDEVSLFHKMGHDVFSPGSYVEPKNPGDATMRPAIPDLQYNEDIRQQWYQLASKYPGQDAKDYLTKDFVDNFDCVIVMHLPRWIEKNWSAMSHKRVIWRTIGQSITPTEQQLKYFRSHGMQIVRYSPKERNIPGYIGEDALIRFCKDPNDYGPWNGQCKRVITFAQHMKQRNRACNFDLFEQVTRPFNRHLFGPGNKDVGEWASGKVPFNQLQEEMRNNCVYFYTGTHPASYTLNFIESWMSGIPIVAVGPKWGNAVYFPNHNLYEVSDLIENYYSGFVSDDPQELRSFIQLLLENETIAKTISNQAREKAIKYFSKDVIQLQWETFLNG